MQLSNREATKSRAPSDPLETSTRSSYDGLLIVSRIKSFSFGTNKCTFFVVSTHNSLLTKICCSILLATE